MVYKAPVREVAHLFWMGVCKMEEDRHVHAEGHAFTAWWVHNGIEFAQGHDHHSWEDWAEMRGLNYGRRKRRKELVAEINERWEKAFNERTRFVQVPMALG